MVSFGEAISLFFKRYVDFQGRSRRSEYWWVQLFNMIVGVVTLAPLYGSLIPAIINETEPEIGMVSMLLAGIGFLYSLAVIIPGIALFIRRLHDINQSGWILLALIVASIIPLIGLLAVIAMIVICVMPGTTGPNKYGPDPKGAHIDTTFS